MKFILPITLSISTISYTLSAATYVTTAGVTQDILSMGGSAHTYSGDNLAPSANLSGANLNNADLTGADLTGADLTLSLIHI